MDDTFLVILICISVLLSIALTVTIVLFVKSRKKWMLASQSQYVKGKEDGKTDAISVINATINNIESDKNKLNQMSEKELMVSTMMALAGYGRRLDETNARLQTITDYKVYISEMNKQMQALSYSYENLQSTVKSAENSLAESITTSQRRLKEAVDSSKQSIESFNTTANTVSGNINVLNSRLTTVEDIRQRIDEINTDLHHSIDLLRSLQTQSSSIMSEMNDMLESYGQSPVAKIDQINHNVSVMFDWVEELKDKFDAVNESDLEDLEKIEEIHEKVEELYEKLEYVSSSDLRDLDKIDDIYSKMDDIYSKTDEILNRLGSEYGYDYNSINYKMDQIESKVSDIASKFNV